jgi:hypothetical protein
MNDIVSLERVTNSRGAAIGSRVRRKMLRYASVSEGRAVTSGQCAQKDQHSASNQNRHT